MFINHTTWTASMRTFFRIALMVTKLSNDDSVNITEVMAALRHRSTSAHKHCNKTSGASETNRHKALGIIKK